VKYIVWTNDYGDSYKKVECGDKPATERAIFEALKEGKEPILTIQVPYSCNVKMGDLTSAEGLTPKPEKTLPPEHKPEEGKDEADKDKTKPH